jgi:hypothetical protein
VAQKIRVPFVAGDLTVACGDPHHASAVNNRRRHDRVKMPLLVQYRTNPLEEFRTDYAADVSEGGIFLQNPVPLPEGTVLQVQFLTRANVRLVSVEARVVRTVPKEGQGVAFIRLDPEDQAALVAALATAQHNG